MKILSACCVDRDNNFNLLRLAGASLVIFGHSYVTYGPQGQRDWLNAHVSVLSAGQLGVQIFFVISGFLVSQSFVNRPHLFEFVVARMLRIFPGLIVALSFTVLLGAFATTLRFSEYVSDGRVWNYFSHNAMLDIRWELPGVFASNSFPRIVNGSLWTLPKEFGLYMILLGIGAAGGLSVRAIANIVCAGAVILHLQKSGTYHLSGGDINVDSVLFCFLVGVLLFVNREHIVVSLRAAFLGVAATALSVMFGYYSFVTVQVCIGYCVMVIAYHDRLQVPVFRKADYSYGLYIYAFPLQQAIAQSGVVHRFGLYVVACFLVILPLAVLSWHLVEKPSMRLRDRLRLRNPLPPKKAQT
jgi:peptidoglycan/LPS O-acetylase OafA/YrhL